MKILDKRTYKGKKEKYVFNIVDYNDDLEEKPVVYIVSKQTTNATGNPSYPALYIGQTDSLKRRFAEYNSNGDFKSLNANRICIFYEDSEKRRFEIEGDLIDIYKPPHNK